MKGSRGFRIVFGIFSLAVFVAYFSLRYATSPKSSDFDDEHAFIYSEIKAVIDSGGDINEFLMNDPRYAFLQEDWQDIVDQNTDQQDAQQPAEAEATPEPTPRPLTEEEKAELEEMELRSSLAESAEDVMSDSNVYNILLIGADGRTEELERSDAMILLSINKTTKTMWLTSLMRDTQVEIADWGIGHLNWATRFGGVDMLINTIESTRNFAVNVDNWAMVDFLDFAKIASMVGPITVTVTKEEAADINPLIREACQLNDAYYGTDVPRCYFPTDQDGTYTISDGFQILGYCRERHVGGDTGRSQKQRDALMQMWGNVKKMSLAEQYALAKDIMSIISTDLTMGQCASLLLQAPDFLTYDIQMQQCPTPGSFWRGLDANGLSIYNADFVINRNFLRATIYGEPMSAADLTSYWSGNAVQVYYPPESDTGDENG